MRRSVTDHLESLLAAATPGPWGQYESLVTGPERHGFDVADCALGSEPDDSPSEWEIAKADAALIVALRNSAPALIRIARAAERLAEISGYAFTGLGQYEAAGASVELREALSALSNPKPDGEG